MIRLDWISWNLFVFVSLCYIFVSKV